jgi:polyribonucleotide nucleotidyltransferase
MDIKIQGLTMDIMETALNQGAGTCCQASSWLQGYLQQNVIALVPTCRICSTTEILYFSWWVDFLQNIIK